MENGNAPLLKTSQCYISVNNAKVCSYVFPTNNYKRWHKKELSCMYASVAIIIAFSDINVNDRRWSMYLGITTDSLDMRVKYILIA